MLQVGSLGYRPRWSLVLGCLLGVPLGPILAEARGKKQVRAEGEIKLEHWPMTSDDPMGALE